MSLLSQNTNHRGDPTIRRFRTITNVSNYKSNNHKNKRIRRIDVSIVRFDKCMR